MTLDIKRQEHLKTIRQYELQQALKYFPTTGHILEIGAGSGWQAQWLNNHGYQVTAVDVPSSQYLQNRVFPIIVYDGLSLPFANHSFDIIFSSNVLEHIVNPTEFNKELKRVLRPDGIAIHIVPTSVWRFWTILTHHIYILQLIINHLKNLFIDNKISYESYNVKNLSKIEIISRLLWPSRHGEQGTAISELYSFSKKSWKIYFEKYDWKVRHCCPIGLFYTGNQIFHKKINNSLRVKMSRFLGSSSIVFFLYLSEQ